MLAWPLATYAQPVRTASQTVLLPPATVRATETDSDVNPFDAAIWQSASASACDLSAAMLPGAGNGPVPLALLRQYRYSHESATLRTLMACVCLTVDSSGAYQAMCPAA